MRDFQDFHSFYVSKVNKIELTNLLKQVAACIGCRKSVETMFDWLSKQHNVSFFANSPEHVFEGTTFNKSRELELTGKLRENDFDQFYSAIVKI